MKKILFSLSVVIFCLCLIPTAAVLADEKTGERGCRQEICEQVCAMENVADCRAVILNRHAFIAVKTKGITTSTANKKLMENIKAKVIEICPDIAEVYVSTSVKAFAAVEDLNNKKELKELLQLFGIKLEDIMPQRPRTREHASPMAMAKPPVKLPYKEGDKRDYRDIIPKPTNLL